MNFVIATAMLMTPLMVKSIAGSGVHAMSSALGAATATAMAAAPARALMAAQGTKSVAMRAGNFVQSKVNSYKEKQEEKRKSLYY